MSDKQTLKCRFYGLEPFIKGGIGIFIIYYHWKIMFLKVYIVVLAVTFKHYANLHTSGYGHFSGKSCQPSVSSNGKATRKETGLIYVMLQCTGFVSVSNNSFMNVNWVS